MLFVKNNSITLERYDYNEPEKGKHQADRESAIAKRFISYYVHAGNNCVSAEDVKARWPQKCKSICCRN